MNEWLRSALVPGLVLSAVIGNAEPVPAQEYVQNCMVTIISPEHGEMVGRQRMVTGKAIVPPAGHLWVFAHIKGIVGWWPQGGGEAEVVDGKWNVLTFLGQDRDIGAQFEILAAIVPGGVNQDLEKYVERGVKSNEWPPMRLPNVLSGCPMAQITVMKTSH